MVEKTLQIKGCAPNIFACGDVIDLPGPRLGRAASYQGMFVGDNIVRSINGKPLKEHKPGVIDASIELTLGVVSHDTGQVVLKHTKLISHLSTRVTM